MNEGRGERADERDTIRAEVTAITERAGVAPPYEPVDNQVMLSIVALLGELTRAVCNLAETLDADRHEEL